MSQSTPLSKKLQAALEGDQAAIKKHARAFLTQPELLPPPAGITTEEYREKTFAWTKKLIASGYSKIPFDTKFGGEGDVKKFINFAEEIGYHDANFFVKQGVNAGLFGGAVSALGTDKHGDIIRRLIAGQVFGGFAMTEVGGGSDVQNVKTEAVYDHATKSFTINTPSPDAKKTFIGNAAVHGELMVVFAQLKMSKDAESQGVHAFLVPVRDGTAGNILPGVTIEDCGEKVGLNGVDNGSLTFKNVKVPVDNMLNRFADIDAEGNYQSDTPKKSARFFKMISTLVMGRVAVAACSLSAAKSALSTSIPYAAGREVFGSVMLDKQATQTRLFGPLADAYAAHFATRRLIDDLVAQDPGVETMAAALKAKITDNSIAMVDEGRLVAGGAGYIADTRYGKLREDVDVFRTFEGDNTVLRLLVAKNQLGALKNQFNGVSGVRLKLKMAKTAANHAFQGAPSGKALDTAYHLKLVERREDNLLYGLSRDIMKIAKKGGDIAQEIDKSCQNDMIAYSDAYADKVMLQEFAKAVDAQKDPETKAVLKDLCDLFAVNTILKNAAWYLETGTVSAEKIAKLRDASEELAAKIRPNAVALVEAFAIPPALLSTPKPQVSAAVQKKQGPKAA
jgi:acyl-CoA oxidase